MSGAMLALAILAAWLAVGMCVALLLGRWIRHADAAQEETLRHIERRQGAVR